MTGLLIKAFMFLFPYIKEIFLGKESINKNKKGKVIIPPNTTKKKVIIVIGCLSVILNIYLVKQIYLISDDNIELTKQLKEANVPHVIHSTLPTKPITPAPVPIAPPKEAIDPRAIVKDPAKVKTKKPKPILDDLDHEKTMDKLNQLNKLSFNTGGN